MDLLFACLYLHVAENGLCNGSRNYMGMRGPNAGNGRKKRINRPSVFWMCCFSVVPLRCTRIFGPGISMPDIAVVCMHSIARDREKEKYEAPRI